MTATQQKIIWPVACVIALCIGLFFGNQNGKSSCTDVLLTVEDHWPVVKMLATGEIDKDRYVEITAGMYHEFDQRSAECR